MQQVRNDGLCNLAPVCRRANIAILYTTIFIFIFKKKMLKAEKNLLLVFFVLPAGGSAILFIIISARYESHLWGIHASIF
jgi:hypothetical protein